MFKKILVANRGEIACRIMRTAKRMGIATVAVYSEADKDALHVRMADEAVSIGPAPARESYLSIDAICKAVKSAGADAVHPGYGFLSENAEFAKRVAKSGAVFIGPGPRAMASMGDKIEAKRIAEKAGVNVIPGHSKALKDGAEAVKIAGGIGYPVMLKAAGGGGGKGMRIAHDDAECREGFDRAHSEAKASFGDGRIFIEKFIENSRHIEIQVLGDEHGNVVHLGERECSIQRRHQKVIEEAPSPLLDAKTRAAMGRQAVQLAKAVKYVSAGTVEFIADADRNFYFLEMNTRLQVEHPVTEFVTGLDLVELMIRIAAGAPLPRGLKDVKLKGWSIEARVCAEDPFRGFLPSTGRLVRYGAPEQGTDGRISVRVDTGVFEGGEISVHYDPMIAKLVVHAKDRRAAVHALRNALDAFYIRGVSTNIGFLAALTAHPRFIDGRLSTQFIAEEYPEGFHPSDVPHEDPTVVAAVAAAIHQAYQERAARISGQTRGHERKVRNDWIVLLKERRFEAAVSGTEGRFKVDVDGRKLAIATAWRLGDPLFQAVIDGTSVCMQVERNGIGYRLMHGGSQIDATVLNPRVAEFYAVMPKKVPPDTSMYLLSPMPGLLLDVAVEEGQEVKAGDTLAVVEAMKMENVLRAERDATVARVHGKRGDSLAVDQVILEFKTDT